MLAFRCLQSGASAGQNRMVAVGEYSGCFAHDDLPNHHGELLALIVRECRQDGFFVIVESDGVLVVADALWIGVHAGSSIQWRAVRERGVGSARIWRVPMRISSRAMLEIDRLRCAASCSSSSRSLGVSPTYTGLSDRVPRGERRGPLAVVMVCILSSLVLRYGKASVMSKKRLVNY
ncbi:hypothetical protein DO71_4330 [Burkholderia pseudomallei]|nr:hypothetical protein DO71_4330 [Burkholderia pseudomallei]